MDNVKDFIRWACTHAKPLSGSDVQYPVGTDGVWCYLWGTKGQIVTKSLLEARYQSYYAPHGWSRAEYDAITKNWVADKRHVTDCQGLLDCYLHTDTTANNNYKSYCTDKGLIKEINRPWVIGEAVFNGDANKKTHVGWVVTEEADPCVVESRGLAYGVVITRLSKRSWKYRGLMTKKFSYDPIPIPPEPTGFVFTRLLKYGCVGDDVVELKKLLIDHGYTDGITIDTPSSKSYGGNTRKLVKKYQKDTGLLADGIAGKNTITSLGGIFKG